MGVERGQRTAEKLANILQRQQAANLTRLRVGGQAAEPGAEDNRGDGILDHALPLVVVPMEESVNTAARKLMLEIHGPCSLVIRILRSKSRQLADRLDLLLDAALDLAEQCCVFCFVSIIHDTTKNNTRVRRTNISPAVSSVSARARLG